MIEIPLRQVPSQTFLISLDEQDCTISLYQRGDRLYLDLAVNGEIVRQGAICLPAINIGGEPYPFSGFLFFADGLSEPDKQWPPQYTDLGTRYKLYYATAEEAESVASGNE